MKTLHVIPIGTGPLRIVLKADQGVYIGEQDPKGSLIFIKDPLRVGSSAAICDALAEGFAEMAKHIRGAR